MKVPMKISRMIGALIAVEGGYSNHPDDPGGETIYGISKRWWPEYWANGRPTSATAREFYYREFWLAFRLDDVPFPVAQEIFECAVNMGLKRAVLFAQKAYNALRYDHWPEIVEDGALGPQTRAALARCVTDARFPISALVLAQNALQCVFYLEHPNRKFRRGWIKNRISFCVEEIRRWEQEGAS